MITYDYIVDAQNTLAENWGDAGKMVVVACLHEKPFNDTFKSFLPHCIACGGNLGGMLLSGIKALYPKVYVTIPDDMGAQAFACICSILLLLGVDTSE